MTQDPIPCSRCQALIPPDEFTQGFAIRVKGHPVCKICVDTGQQRQRSKEQLEVQNMHIMRFSDMQNPDLNRYTFLTAGHIALHRKIFREKGSFDPPELEKKHETEAITRTTKRRQRSAHDMVTSYGHERRKRAPAKSGNPLLIVGMLGAVIVAVVIVLLMDGNAGNESLRDVESTVATESSASKSQNGGEQKAYKRSDFPSVALTAWRSAVKTVPAGHAVLDEIAEELRQQTARAFQVIQDHLDQEELIQAETLIKRLRIPSDERFEGLASRLAVLNKRSVAIKDAQEKARLAQLDKQKTTNRSEEEPELEIEVVNREPLPSKTDLPSPWLSTDIGAVKVPGSADFNNGAYTVRGSGADIWDKNELHFMYQKMSGDCRIVARVQSMENTNGWAKAGVMIRQSNNSSSAYAACILTPKNGVRFQYLAENGKAKTAIKKGNRFAAPYWLRLDRTGDSIKAACSKDGLDWSELGVVSVSMSGEIEVGLCVCSHKADALCETVFTDVKLGAYKQSIAENSDASHVNNNMGSLTALQKLNLIIGDYYKIGAGDLKVKADTSIKQADKVAEKVIKGSVIDLSAENNYLRAHVKDSLPIYNQGFVVFRFRPVRTNKTQNFLCVSDGKSKTVHIYGSDAGQLVVRLRKKNTKISDARSLQYVVAAKTVQASLAKYNDIEIGIGWNYKKNQAAVYVNRQRVHEVDQNAMLKNYKGEIPSGDASRFVKIVYGAGPAGKVSGPMTLKYFRMYPTQKFTAETYPRMELDALSAPTKPLAAAHKSDAWERKSFADIMGAAEIVAADCNGDGHQDLIVRGDGKKLRRNLVFMNDGKGGFTGDKVVSFGSDALAALACADMDGDGDVDIVCSDDGDLKIFYNNNGKFLFSSKGLIAKAGKKQLKQLHLVDMNGDKQLDIVAVIDKELNKIYYNTPNQSAAQWRALEFGRRSSIGAVINDVNADGRNDILMISKSKTKSLYGFINNGSGFDKIEYKENMGISDMNNCLLISKNGVPTLNVISAKGKKSILNQFEISNQQLKKSTAEKVLCTVDTDMAGADLDGDGKLDYITCYNQLLNVTTALGAHGPMSSHKYKSPNNIIIADFNADGLDDCLFLDRASSRAAASVYLYVRKAAE